MHDTLLIIIENGQITKRKCLMDITHYNLHKVGLSRRLLDIMWRGGKILNTSVWICIIFSFQNECANTLSPCVLYKSERREADK